MKELNQLYQCLSCFLFVPSLQRLFSLPRAVYRLYLRREDIPLLSWMSSLLKYLNSLVNWPTEGAGWLNINKAKVTVQDLTGELFLKLS